MSPVFRLWNLLSRWMRRVVSLLVHLLSLAERARLAEQMTSGLVAVVSTRRGDLRMGAATPVLLARARNLLTKERDTIQWIDAFPDGAVFWDVGANVGVYSLYAASRGGTTVLAFEPGAANYGALCHNIHLNGLANVRAYCIAFARETRMGVLNMSSPAPGGAMNQFGDEGEVSRYAIPTARGTMQGAIGLSIDDFIDRFGPPFPGFLKIDVDGIEWPILQGANCSLRDSRLRSVLAELTIGADAENAQIVSLLQECGFRLTARGEVQTAPRGAGCNHIFSR